MKTKKLLPFVFSVLTLLLEMLPWGAVLNFATPDGEPYRKTFSYFNPITYGYANFGPFITAILTTILMLLCIINLIKYNNKISYISLVVSIIALISSLAPLMHGIRSYSVIGAAISALLLFECIILIPRKCKY